ncbi:hypothetical protein BBJ29_003211 [Phytophthora kernoviae]|uniref:non-specific serine/threonine protein kinase n=1 Tax=Phytophthora kernoviae TaxID=325452 RepID=A0A3R7JNB8_9STRA|nr:hypothetical protein BBJ29_003211 [Phytophthora kernoviae]
MFQEKLCMHHKAPATDTYRTLGTLGRGAFGVVEKVEHLKTHKLYAMKTVHFKSGSKRHEFEKEINILRGLHHPNIVRMIETFEDQHHFYIIMELSPGGTMLDRVKSRGKKFPENEVKEVMRTLASVVQYLHSRTICPEVLEGNYKESCDLWSLGVIMYMLLTNKAPFYGDTEDDLVESIFVADVKYKGPEWDAVSSEAKALLKKLLNVNAAARFTAAEMLVHPWIKSIETPIPPEVYDEFVPRVKAFCEYSPLRRTSLVALAFCMSSSQVELHSAVYNELNIAHNGELTLQELELAPSLMSFQLNMDKIMKALDQQHENGINLLEFVAATLSPEDAANEELLHSAFHILDRSHRGALSTEDLKWRHFDTIACQEMIKRYDIDKDGKIGFNDFVKMMKVSILCASGQHIFTSRLILFLLKLPSKLSGKISKTNTSIVNRRSSDIGARRLSASGSESPAPTQRRSVSNVGSGDGEPVSKEEALKTIEALRNDVAIATIGPEKVDIHVTAVKALPPQATA